MKLTPFHSDKSEPVTFDGLYASTRTMHLVFLGSTIIYVVVGLLVKSFVMEGEPGFADLPRSIYSALFVIMSAVSVALGYLTLAGLPRRPAGQGSPAGSGVSSSVDLGRQLLLRHLIRLAFSDTIAIFGLVLFLSNGSLLPLLLFPGVTFALLVAIYPRREQWEEARWQAEQKGMIRMGE